VLHKAVSLDALTDDQLSALESFCDSHAAGHEPAGGDAD
jgi:hypothetical protein